MAKNIMARNMIILTLSGIVAKTVDFSFRAYYSGLLGEEGMGIFSLVMGAFGIILNLSSAGVGAAVSRLCSMEQSRGNYGAVRKIMKTAVGLVVFLGTLCWIFVLFASDKIAISYLKDIRCSKPLSYIAPSAIFMGISYCIKGYFYADRKILIPATSEFVEQAVKITVISLLLKRWLPLGIEQGCSAVFLGLTVGEMCSCLYLCIWYRAGLRAKASGESQLLPILNQTLPMTFSMVGGSFLRTLEDIWIVRGFKKFGMGAEGALGAYGLIHGMAMPLLVFPLTLISSFMALLVPEISRAEEGGRLRDTVRRVYGVAWFFGCIIFCVFFVFAKELSTAVYGSPKAAVYVRPLSVLCPVMIIDSISTGMLNGLGEQMKLLKYSLSDSALRLFMVYFLLPMGGNGVIVAMIFLSNILTCFLTVRRINQKAKIDGLGISALKSVLPAILTVAVIMLVRPLDLNLAELCGCIVLTAAVYSVLSIKKGHLARCPEFKALRRK